jgi:hypothetical protein
VYLATIIGLLLFFSIVVYTSISLPHSFNYFLEPGLTVAGLVFVGGIHGDFLEGYIALAVVINALLWAWIPTLIVFLGWAVWRVSYAKKSR